MAWFLWSHGSRFGGCSDVGRRDTEEEGRNDGGSRQPSALHAKPMQHHNWDVISPLSPRFFKSCCRHIPIRVTHPRDGSHQKRRCCKRKENPDETEDLRSRVLSTWPAGYLHYPQYGGGIGMCRGRWRVVFPCHFLDRSLLVGWGWLRSRTTYEIPSDFSDCLSRMPSTDLVKVQIRRGTRKRWGPKEAAALQV
jgi:hypothetical protein